MCLLVLKFGVGWGEGTLPNIERSEEFQIRGAPAHHQLWSKMVQMHLMQVVPALHCPCSLAKVSLAS